jgi:quercetin dioxygenase-like cupin family protein
VTYFSKYHEPSDGFAVIAGRDHGLQQILVAVGTLPPGAGGPLHLHHGEEVLRILTGEVDVQVGSTVRRCEPGDVIIIPADTLHGFRTRSAVTMEVVAEQNAGQIFPITDERGERRLIEIYRQDMPWSRQPPHGFDWTSDALTKEIVAQAPEVGLDETT